MTANPLIARLAMYTSVFVFLAGVDLYAQDAQPLTRRLVKIALPCFAVLFVAMGIVTIVLPEP